MLHRFFYAFIETKTLPATLLIWITLSMTIATADVVVEVEPPRPWGSSATNGFSPWNSGTSWGFTFTAPSNAGALEELTLHAISPAFDVHLVRWDNEVGSPSGGLLLASDSSQASTASRGAYTAYTYSSNIAVISGATYATILTRTDSAADTGFKGAFSNSDFFSGRDGSDVYPGGDFFFSLTFDPTNPSATSGVQGYSSSHPFGPADAVFSARFSAVPEPSSLAMLGIATAVWGGMRRRKRLF